jgi:hypothetical protein
VPHYYWFGENKEKSVKGTNIWTWGVRCYVSDDLYNWEDKGLLIPPDTENPDSPLNPAKEMDRPHIIYNERTKKWVCWMKIMDNVISQSMSLLTADKFSGPYTIVKTGYKPCGFDSGDFDLEVDRTTGKAYIFFEKVHTELIIAELTDDYLGTSGRWASNFPHNHPPAVREAPTHFMHKGKHYLFTSGTTGYFPNPTEVSVADDWLGPYTVLGNPHENDKAEMSFSSQINEVLKLPDKQGKDKYIVIADRWLPHLPQSRFLSRSIRRATDKMFDKAKKVRTQEDKPLDNNNTVESTYVWLPLRFEKQSNNIEMPLIDWHNEWKREDL